MVKLNVDEVLKRDGKSRYWLFNEINNRRSTKKDECQLSYTNFKRLVDQVNQSIRYKDIEELCKILECDVSELLVITKGRKK